MIDKSKTYRTRDGREVRIYATDGNFANCVHGAVKNDLGWWFAESWTSEGINYNGNTDLIEIRPRHKRTV